MRWIRFKISDEKKWEEVEIKCDGVAREERDICV